LDGAWYVSIDELAKCDGIGGLTGALLLMNGPPRKWQEAVPLVTGALGVSSRTVEEWCQNRQGFAKRLGDVWYIDLEEMKENWTNEEDCETAG